MFLSNLCLTFWVFVFFSINHTLIQSEAIEQLKTWCFWKVRHRGRSWFQTSFLVLVSVAEWVMAHSTAASCLDLYISISSTCTWNLFPYMLLTWCAAFISAALIWASPNPYFLVFWTWQTESGQENSFVSSSYNRSYRWHYGCVLTADIYHQKQTFRIKKNVEEKRKRLFCIPENFREQICRRSITTRRMLPNEQWVSGMKNVNEGRNILVKSEQSDGSEC